MAPKMATVSTSDRVTPAPQAAPAILAVENIAMRFATAEAD